MHVRIEPGCIGCGACAATCPEVFALGEDGLAEVLRAPEGDEEGLAEEAAAGCPVNVIRVDG